MAKKKWIFVTKKEALAKFKTLKNPLLYEITRNRDENGKFAKGWILC